MENTGAVIFGDYVYKNNRELLDGNDQSTIAHELFHHWFGDLVTCESWSNLPLNESFAKYSQYLWDEYRYGLDEADYQADGEAEGYYQSSQGGGYHNLIWFDYEDKEQMFDGHSYNKGGRILHMLRNYLGDEAFFKGINLYLTTYKFKPAEFHQLRLAFEEVSGEDLNWFFNQWFLASGHPVIDVAQSVNAAAGTVKLTVKQNQNLEVSPIYKLPVDVAIFDAEGKHVHKITIDKVDQEFVLPFKGDLKCVIFDDQQMLLAKIREDKPVDQYIFQYYNGKRFKARRSGLALGTKSKDPRVQQLILDALNDPFWDIRLTAIEKAAKLNVDNKAKGLALIKDLATEDANSQVRSSALNYLATNAEADVVKEICLDRIAKDQSYLVVSAALKQLGKIDAELAMAKAAVLESERSSKMISGIAQLYGSYGTKEKFIFFENALKGSVLQGFDQLGVMNSLTYFVSRQEVEGMERAYELYVYLGEHGAFYTQMFLPQNINYLMSLFDQKIEELNVQVAEFEKNKDAAYADQARKKIKAYEELKSKFAPLVAVTQEE
jgi:aminopeptidase N